MGDYTNMSSYYDVIMTSGYYDYAKIVDALEGYGPFSNILEIGCGTGLILEELASRASKREIVGIDLTKAMLLQARQRLQKFPSISLQEQNVCSLDLEGTFETAFSYGGVWYFVVEKGKAPFMVSHIPDEAGNAAGLKNIAEKIAPGGILLLGIQGPHFDYEKPISNGMTYAQKIHAHDYGFTKHYFLLDEGRKVMEQTIDYRTYSWDATLAMLEALGFSYSSEQPEEKFIAFRKAA